MALTQRRRVLLLGVLSFLLGMAIVFLAAGSSSHETPTRTPVVTVGTAGPPVVFQP